MTENTHDLGAATEAELCCQQNIFSTSLLPSVQKLKRSSPDAKIIAAL